MKKFLAVLVVAAAMVWLGSTVRADVSAQGGEIGPHTQPIRTLVVARQNTDSAGNFSARNVILGFKAVTTSAAGGCILYDAATVPSGDTGMIDEITEATAAETNLQMWPYPYQLTTDLSVRVIGSQTTCIIYYQ